MTRKYLAFAMLMLVSAAGYTQENDPHLPVFEFGPKLGVNINKIDGQPFRQEFNYGYNAGVFAALKLGKNWQLAPEVLFNQYTTRTDTSFNNIFDVKNVSHVKLNYLSLPVLLNYCPSKVFAFQFGPQFGVLIDHDQSLVQNGKQAIKNGDLSLLGGVQISIANFKLNGRYFIGLNDISDASNSSKWRNQGFQLSVGWRII